MNRTAEGTCRRQLKARPNTTMWLTVRMGCVPITLKAATRCMMVRAPYTVNVPCSRTFHDTFDATLSKKSVKVSYMKRQLAATTTRFGCPRVLRRWGGRRSEASAACSRQTAPNRDPKRHQCERNARPRPHLPPQEPRRRDAEAPWARRPRPTGSRYSRSPPAPAQRPSKARQGSAARRRSEGAWVR